MIQKLELIHPRSMSPYDLEVPSLEPLPSGTDCVVGLVLMDPQGQFFVQRRSLDRKLFPGCWDIVGGHVEPGESLLGAMRREMMEETGWELQGQLSLVARVEWTKSVEQRTIPVVEWDFLLRLEGFPGEAQVERTKVDRWDWISAESLSILLEHRDPEDQFIYKLVKHCFSILEDL